MFVKKDLQLAALILTCMYGYFFKFEPALFYHYQQPLFLLDQTFFNTFLTYPGGILEWISLFITQFFIVNGVGALILSAFVVMNYLLIRRILNCLPDLSKSPFLAYLPIVFILILSIRYNTPFVIFVRLLFSHIVFLLYARARQWKFIFFIFSWPVYFILGGWAFLYCCLLVLLYQVFYDTGRLKYIYSAAPFIVGFVCPAIAAHFVFFITQKEAFSYLFPRVFVYPPFLFVMDWTIILLFITLPIILVFTKFYLLLKKSFNKRKSFNLLKNNLLQSALIIFFSIAIFLFSKTAQQDIPIQIDRAAAHSNWHKVLSLSAQLDEYDRDVNFQVNRARFFLNDLLENLFVYPQLLGVDGLFNHKIMVGTIALPASDLFYDLGHINASQIMAYEALTKRPNNPRIMQRLVQTNLIQGNLIVAENFLKVLRQSPVHHQWAEKKLTWLQAKGNETDSEIATKIKSAPTSDFLLNKVHVDVDLVHLLNKNSQNQMAFEYLVAFYLLEGRLADVADHLPQFAAYGYKRLPQHVAEAMLFMKMMQPDDDMLKRISFDKKMIKDFMTFNQLLVQNKNNPARAKYLLSQKYGNTFWFYLRFIKSQSSERKLNRRKIEKD